jgi:hypothetical protein
VDTQYKEGDTRSIPSTCGWQVTLRAGLSSPMCSAELWGASACMLTRRLRAPPLLSARMHKTHTRGPPLHGDPWGWAAAPHLPVWTGSHQLPQTPRAPAGSVHGAMTDQWKQRVSERRTAVPLALNALLLRCELRQRSCNSSLVGMRVPRHCVVCSLRCCKRCDPRASTCVLWRGTSDARAHVCV